ncbi:MAG: bifunctional UDP-3-O-[3-hydroxymyristoyl] N-acetylglucosamine deacetylase/3-hydroxyacyl-ACP dehydratase [Bacteroidetes bacterium]|nr:bifunctional UDP-3-O-[3-hydroxymyristoyl] N-acetylglucosamine deacetylase/3-hydroxyacyl-ACP dehydratase [Bacteroidota bacterium]MCZ2133161.1 bifunctional UDP-3-O-[3-hydroxymyristoyl] N-acetylglucosamine deacetylase/3-hydroxyacyl-ACP dehydratase [Bacteroidota bacterium]
MTTQQHTLKESASISGVGLHTGNLSTITFCPAPENYGFRFVRTDLPGSPEIPALADYVTDISRGTTLTCNDARVHTVEHVLAALSGLQIDNCRIELDANEPPVADGSALPFAEKMLTVGLERQQALRNFIVIEQTVRYTDEQRGVDIVALPNEDYRITVMVDYNNPALGSQHSGIFNLEKEFMTEFASARTFCFLSEVETLHKQGLIKGGSINNAVVILDRDITQDELTAMLRGIGFTDEIMLGSNGILNNNHLRFKNEPARHKLLDMLGDLSLVGAPMKAQVLAARPGHAANIEFAKKIRRTVAAKKTNVQAPAKSVPQITVAKSVLDINAIMRAMPHRYPFLLVDRIVELDAEVGHIVGLKNVTLNEPFFMGHFPAKPIMPGVLIIEAMAQTGGLLLLGAGEPLENKLALFVAINNAKFRRQVVPGDQLLMDVTMTSKRFNTFSLKARGYVDGQIAAEADLTAAIVDANK